MSVPHPFQEATIRAALAAFDIGKVRRRFLVADEVGLGKTVVAKEVVRHMSEDGQRPLVIYYIANGHAVAHQNKGRIVGFLKGERRKAATRTPDRLSLIAIEKRPVEPVVIYALTPATSFPSTHARLTGGRKEERAFLSILLEKAYPAFARELDKDLLRLSAQGSWDWAVEEAVKRFENAPAGLVYRFREALAAEFGEPVRSMLERAVWGDPDLNVSPLRPTAFVGRLRRALAMATLRHQPPHIVVLDEFQRYRELLEESETNPLLKALLQENQFGQSPAVLLLSATPYPHLATRWEEARGALAHVELLKLINFLGGPVVRNEANVLFSAFGDRLRDIATRAKNASARLEADVSEAATLGKRLRRLLTPLMSRTERDSVVLPESAASTKPLQADPTIEDFAVFKHLADGFSERQRHEALPYWSSVPLPAQSLGPRYAAWKGASFGPSQKLVRMTLDRRNRIHAPPAWPDAKLRAIRDIAPMERLSLPWVAPSLPWWPFGGAWAKTSADPKFLMFSRFRATPPSVAALLSFDVESHCLHRRGTYTKVMQRRSFKLAAVPGPVMAAFHPSPWLIRHTDPLAKAGASMAAVRKEVQRQILAALPKGILDRSTSKARQRHRPVARVLASIERLAGLAAQSSQGWKLTLGEDRAAQAAALRWRQAQPIERLSPLELTDLVDYAIGAPGIALGRALYRHDLTILDPTRYVELVRLSWHGLRPYLDNPVILSALTGRNAVERVMRAVVDGGFESMLDEHFWLRAPQLEKGSFDLAADLKAALGLRSGGFTFHGLDRDKAKIPVRCHVAMPFGDAEAEPTTKFTSGVSQAAPARPDEVRRSFNSPFWPHVLATTSVGQEGLDFHPWCARVVHWDLSSNPLDLEQREGRVQRYAGLAIRRKLGELLWEDIVRDPAMGRESPWRSMERHAERLTDTSGLRPWWVLDGAKVQRHVFQRPFGRDEARFAQLKEQRMIYRLALGQPNQEDFIAVLSRGGEEARRLLQPLVLDLSAMGLHELTHSVGNSALPRDAALDSGNIDGAAPPYMKPLDDLGADQSAGEVKTA